MTTVTPQLIPQAAADDTAGVFGWSAGYERLAQGLHNAITDVSPTPETAVTYPPVIPRSTIVRAEYLAAFPQLVGSVSTWRGTAATMGQLLTAADAGPDWGPEMTPSDVVLAPAVCYHLYPQHADTRLHQPVVADVRGFCFRAEDTAELGRLRSFRMRELVGIGTPDWAAAQHTTWLALVAELLTSLGLTPSVDPASDPFFGPGRRLLAAAQRDNGYKLEFRVPLEPGGPLTAIASVNQHTDHLGTRFSITTDGGTAHSLCAAFGIDRIVLALIHAHGEDTAAWPPTVRHTLHLENDDAHR
jgi:seryl-tRNA synthetase